MLDILTPNERLIVGASLVSGVVGAGLLVYAFRLWLAERDAKAMAVGALLAKGNGNGESNKRNPSAP